MSFSNRESFVKKFVFGKIFIQIPTEMKNPLICSRSIILKNTVNWKHIYSIQISVNKKRREMKSKSKLVWVVKAKRFFKKYFVLKKSNQTFHPFAIRIFRRFRHRMTPNKWQNMIKTYICMARAEFEVKRNGNMLLAHCSFKARLTSQWLAVT